MVSARNEESNLGYTSEVGQDTSAINLPSLLTKLMKELLGYKSIVDNTSSVTWSVMKPFIADRSDGLIEMQKACQEGYSVAMLIDSDMLPEEGSVPHYYLPNLSRWHWIAYEGDLFIDVNNDGYLFSYFCWGKKYSNISFKMDVFNTNYYGYIKGK